MGVDTDKNALLYTRGFLVAEEGSNIANWITSNEGFYHLNSSNKKDLWLSPGGISGVVNNSGTQSFMIYANGNFGVTTGGTMYAKNANVQGAITSDNVNITGGSLKIGNNFNVDNSGNLTASNANINGTITTGNLTATGGNISNLSADNISASNFTMNSGSLTIGSNFKVTSDGKLSCSSATIKGSISASTISGSTISGTVFRTNYVDGAYRTILDSNGSIKYYNGVGFLSCGLTSNTLHPWLSALNVNYTNGISFRNGLGYGDAGDEIDYIRHSGTSMYIQSGANMNIGASGSQGIGFDTKRIRLGDKDTIIEVGDEQTGVTVSRFEFNWNSLVKNSKWDNCRLWNWIIKKEKTN